VNAREGERPAPSGKPHTVVSDKGTELISEAILRCSQERRVA